MTGELKIWMPGTQVDVGPFAAIVDQVCIHSEDHITYQVEWWYDNERKSAWVRADEILGKAEQRKLGFK